MESDSDSAPEEENVQVSARRIKDMQKETTEQRKAALAKEKDKRRKQSEFFAQQKRLPVEFLESLENSKDTGIDESEEAEASSIRALQDLVESHKRSTSTHKTFSSIQKGPVTVKVTKNRNRALAPKREAVISKKNKFLNRRSIKRK